jgi:hypothetical protein
MRTESSFKIRPSLPLFPLSLSPFPLNGGAQLAAERFFNHACASVDFTHSPATCLVATLSRFHTLIEAMAIINVWGRGREKWGRSGE